MTYDNAEIIKVNTISKKLDVQSNKIAAAISYVCFASLVIAKPVFADQSSLNEKIQERFVVAQLDENQNAVSPPVLEEDNELSSSETDRLNSEEEVLLVTGSRLRTGIFADDLPIQVLGVEIGEAIGFGNVEELIRLSPLLTGSQQIDDQLSSVAIGGSRPDGGNGTNQISIRGLGPERTLILVDGRRLTPSGTGGGVSSPNISILPSSILSSVDILKDGASSIYGSDAVAGIVNNRILGATDKSELSILANIPEEAGGEFIRASGRFSQMFEKGHFNIAIEYTDREELELRDREYTDCRDSRFSDPNTGEILDIRDANGNIHCQGFNNQTVNRFFFFDNSLRPVPGEFINDPDGTIVAPGGVAQAVNQLRMVLPEFALVNFPNSPDIDAVRASYAQAPQVTDVQQRASAINAQSRFSLFANGAYELTPAIEVYGQFLYSNLEIETNRTRFLFANLSPAHPSNSVAARAAGVFNFLSGQLQFNLLRPYDSVIDTDYIWSLAGVRGDFGGLRFFEDWEWDVFLQHGLSDAESTENFTRADRFRAATDFSSNGCNESAINASLIPDGQTAASLCNSIGGAIPWLTPRILRDGQFNEAEMAFVEGTETATTEYDQSILEGYISGELASLPAGKISTVIGFHLRADSIDYQPGANSLASNNLNTVNDQATKGSVVIKELFTEIGIPLVSGVTMVENLNLNLSGRFTDHNRIDDGGEFTYRTVLGWELTEWLKVRVNQGTSYRAPALFELFEGGSESFGGVDSCVNIDTSGRPANEVANLRQNCGLFGIGGTFNSSQSLRTLSTGNTTGQLKAETSKAQNIGIVFGNDAIGLSAAIDYFKIDVENQIERFGPSQILERCLVNQSFNTLDEFNANSFCQLLGNRDSTGALLTVSNPSFNLAKQGVEGIDYTIQYQRDLFSNKLSAFFILTQMLEDFVDFGLADNDPVNDDIDRTLNALRSEFAGNLSVSYGNKKWGAHWNIKYIGESDQVEQFRINPNLADFHDGVVSVSRFQDPVMIDTKVEEYFEHTLSFRYTFGESTHLTAGVANVFDEEPPQVGINVERVGSSASGPYDFRGRRFFLSARQSF